MSVVGYVSVVPVCRPAAALVCFVICQNTCSSEHCCVSVVLYSVLIHGAIVPLPEPLTIEICWICAALAIDDKSSSRFTCISV